MPSEIKWVKDNVVEISGEIDEFFPFDELFNEPPEEFYIDTSKVTRLNSVGIREWVQKTMKLTSKFHLINTCPEMVIACSQITQMLGENGVMDSFYLSFDCDDCEHEQLVFFKVGKDIQRGQESYQEPDPVPCPECEGSMCFSYGAEIFSSFLS